MSLDQGPLARRFPAWDNRIVSDTKIIEVGHKGRVVIPAAVRRELGIEAGTRLAVLIDEGAIVLVPRESVEDRLLALFKGVQTSLSEELLEERRAEAARDSS